MYFCFGMQSSRIPRGKYYERVDMATKYEKSGDSFVGRHICRDFVSDLYNDWGRYGIGSGLSYYFPDVGSYRVNAI